ncbi:MAG: type 1 glutamine amidotransferase [Candidatus Methanoperedens sp.]|nr:type 1 glutamine amidotransferase [Candidatus Methanoperedens sp.]
MRIHSIEHEKFEGLANIEVWAKNGGHSISRTLLFNGEELPDITDIDWLVIMGGSMNIYEEEKYPWLRDEKNFIAQAIAGKKIVLGICLGAQLIADVLGRKISKNKHKEIGWFPLTLTKEGRTSPIFGSFPPQFTAVHWHGDTFDIPHGATRIAQSEACANQAFEYGRTIGLQFHLEYSAKSIYLMFRNCADEIVEGRYIQKPDEIISQNKNVVETQRLLNLLLDNMEKELSMLQYRIPCRT